MHHQSGTDIALVCSDSVNANPVRPMQVQGGEAGLSRVQGNKAPTETSNTEEEEDEVARGASQRGSGGPRAPEGGAAGEHERAAGV